jgi:hypothetical protein
MNGGGRRWISVTTTVPVMMLLARSVGCSGAPAALGSAQRGRARRGFAALHRRHGMLTPSQLTAPQLIAHQLTAPHLTTLRSRN